MATWLSPQPLVLASKSDVRGKMLAAVGLRFEIRPAQIDERAVETKAGTTDAAAVARFLARAKASAVAASLPGRLVLGADQVLARGATRFSKPAGRAELFDCVDSARLTMRNISDRFLEDYLDMAGDAALASVGAYQLEGIGIHLFERVEGDYFTIFCLPLLALLGHLRA